MIGFEKKNENPGYTGFLAIVDCDSFTTTTFVMNDLKCTCKNTKEFPNGSN